MTGLIPLVVILSIVVANAHKELIRLLLKEEAAKVDHPVREQFTRLTWY